MSPITTHVLNLMTGRPAVGVKIEIDQLAPPGEWQQLARGITDIDGRLRDLLPDDHELSGMYRITFDTETYFTELKVKTFYPFISIVFEVTQGVAHYHVPLLLSPWGYSTYRGS